LRKLLKPNLYVALVHYPVINKTGNIIVSAVTNLDLHDIARASRTYGVKKFYVVTPIDDQKELIKEIISHWTSGIGSSANPDRRLALELVSIMDSLNSVKEDIEAEGNGYPKTVITSAKESTGDLTYPELKKMLENPGPYLLVFGTGWGLAEEIILKADYALEPVKGNTDYNHLSVRSACSIILDRLIRG
jgi:hypothetical protein